MSFYVTYLAYRNLKSVVPLLRPDELFDGRLADLDRSLFAGSDPADAAAQRCSAAGSPRTRCRSSTRLFFVFIPVALAFALVVLPDLRAGLFLTTALALNWALAAASYFLLPSLGPIYAEPADFAHLPAPASAGCRRPCSTQRDRVPARPVGGGRRAEHRRLRLAARLDLLHRGAGDAPARARRVP